MLKRSTVSFLTAALCLVVAAAALAAGSDFSSLSKRSVSKPLNTPGQNAKLTVECNGGKTAVSGGFDIGKVGFNHGPVTTSSRPKGEGWAASANEFANSGPQNDKLTGDVYCASKAPGLSVKTASASVAPGQVTSLKASCGGEKNVIAGGFKTRYNGGSGISGVIIFSSYRKDAQTWKVTASGVGGQMERPRQRSAGAGRGSVTPVKAYAVCASVPALKVGSKSAKGSTSKTHPRANAKCPKHREIVSGGFKSAIRTGKFNMANLPEASELKDKRTWRTQGYFFPLGGGSLKWTGYAYCA